MSARPTSQATFTVRTDAPVSPEPTTTVRKTSVLSEFEPERIVAPKKREGPSLDVVTNMTNMTNSNDKVKRFVDHDGHVVKVTVLSDFVPASKPHGKKTKPSQNYSDEGKNER